MSWRREFIMLQKVLGAPLGQDSNRTHIYFIPRHINQPNPILSPPNHDGRRFCEDCRDWERKHHEQNYWTQRRQAFFCNDLLLHRVWFWWSGSSRPPTKRLHLHQPKSMVRTHPLSLSIQFKELLTYLQMKILYFFKFGSIRWFTWCWMSYWW